MRWLVLAVVVWSSRVRAEPLPPLVSWRAPIGCGDETAVRGAIASRAGRTISDGGEPYAVVEVTTGDSAVAHVTLSANGNVTDHELRAATCDELADAVAVLVAAAWGPSKKLPPLLSWRAPAGCPEESELRVTIASRARRTRADGAEPYAIVAVTADASGFAATLQLKAGKLFETREVHGATCAEVADAVAWMLAIAWAPPPELHPAIEAMPAPQISAPSRPLPLHLHVAARTIFDAGTLPGGDGGLGLALGIADEHHLELELAATKWADRFAPVMAGAGVEVGLATVSGQLCSDLVFACVGLELGRLTGRGVQLDASRVATLDWAAATIGLRWRHRLASRVRVVVDGGAVIRLGDSQFALDDGTVAFRPTAIAARLGIGVEFAPSW